MLGGQSLGIAAAAIAVLVLTAETVEYVAERIWWISGTAGACYALAVAAGMWLERRNDRKAAAWGAARGIYSRAEVILPYPVRAEAVTSSSTGPAIGPAVVHLHFHGVPAAEQAAIIRQASRCRNPQSGAPAMTSFTYGKPTIARTYDALLGGYDNFAPDRALEGEPMGCGAPAQCARPGRRDQRRAMVLRRRIPRPLRRAGAGHISGRGPADIPHRQLRFWRILALAAMPARCSARTGTVPTALEP